MPAMFEVNQHNEKCNYNVVFLYPSDCNHKINSATKCYISLICHGILYPAEITDKKTVYAYDGPHSGCIDELTVE